MSDPITDDLKDDRDELIDRLTAAEKEVERLRGELRTASGKLTNTSGWLDTANEVYAEIDAALTGALGEWGYTNPARRMVAGVKILAEERDAVRAALFAQEQALNFELTCLGCAKTLAGALEETRRAERAEADRDAARAELAKAQQNAVAIEREARRHEGVLVEEIRRRERAENELAQTREAQAPLMRAIGTWYSARSISVTVAGDLALAWEEYTDAAGVCEFCTGSRCTECLVCPRCSGDGHSESCSQPEAAPSAVETPAPDQTPTLVWVATVRRDVDYHQLTDRYRTACGRSAIAGGVIVDRDQVIERYAARLCSRCAEVAAEGGSL